MKILEKKISRRNKLKIMHMDYIVCKSKNTDPVVFFSDIFVKMMELICVGKNI